MKSEEAVARIPQNLNLPYRWERTAKGAAWIVVAERLRYCDFSHWLHDVKTNKKVNSDTWNAFKLACQKIAVSMNT